MDKAYVDKVNLYCKRLNINAGASKEAIKQAYRKLAKKLHPDVVASIPNITEEEKKEYLKKSQDIGEAYDFLSDEKFSWTHYFRNTKQNDQDKPVDDTDYADVSSEDAKKEWRRRAPSGRGLDIHYNLSISLLDAFFGKRIQITIDSMLACNACRGKGGTPLKCPGCAGHGAVGMEDGGYIKEVACPTCSGTGKVIKDLCIPCKGDGRIPGDCVIDVKIAPGIEDGQKLTFSGKGEAGLRGGSAGDMVVFVSIRSDSNFKRKNDDLITQMEITMVDAVLGTKKNIISIDNNKLEVKIPEGTQPGDRIRVKGMGMPTGNLLKRRGNLDVIIKVVIPKAINDEQKRIIKMFAES